MNQFPVILLAICLFLTATVLPAEGEINASQEKKTSPIHALILTGNDGPFHDWRKTHLVLKEALERDPRFEVTVSEDIEILAREDLSKYSVLIQNYVNWQSKGLSEKAKSNLSAYLKNGGGLAVIHFAGSAFHFSLPGAAESDWPEYRKIVRRVWNHNGKGDAQSSHDGYGPITVRVTSIKHPITEGMTDFQSTDELYYNQNGDEPIEPLLTAKSNNTGRDEPMAWAYNYGEGRVFQTVLGHDTNSLHSPGMMELIRRDSLWAANQPIISSTK